MVEQTAQVALWTLLPSLGQLSALSSCPVGKPRHLFSAVSSLVLVLCPAGVYYLGACDIFFSPLF